MKNKSLVRRVAILATLFSLAIARPAHAQEDGELLAAERRIMDRLAESYSETDWNAVELMMLSNPGNSANANVMVIPLSLANVFLHRFESGSDPADLERSIQYLEWAARDYPLWRQTWLTASVAQYFALTVLRVRASESAATHDRIDVLWESAREILEAEADARLGEDLPYRDARTDGGDPYDSSRGVNSHSEENAWEAVLLAGAANFLPEHPHAAAWDAKARELAYDAITRPSDSPDAFGIKTTTVTESFLLPNHKKFPNPYYMAATLMLLSEGALNYRLTGRAVPPEFGHNVRELFGAYRDLVDASLEWTVPADPAGDATLFPLPYDPEFERDVVALKDAQGDLWAPVSAVSWLCEGPDLMTATQNAKVVMYYLMGSYLWRVAPLVQTVAPMTDGGPDRPTPELVPDGPRMPTSVPPVRPAAD
jgi:hypothetical protein